MDTARGFVQKNEYSVSVENVAMRLLINEMKISDNSDEYNRMLHGHLFSELFVCLSGEIHIQTEDGILCVPKDCALLMPANVPHAKIPATDSVWYSVGFSVSRKKATRSTDLYNQLKAIFEADEPTVYGNAADLCQAVAALHGPLPKTVECLPALELICSLSKLALKETQRRFLSNKPQARTPDIYRMACLEEIIQNHFSEPLRSETVAAMLNVSPRQFSRIIQDYYHTTFHRVLVKKRLESAALRLSAEETPVQQIMKEVGYENATAFYKDFSARYGVTPSAYRQTVK